MSANVIVRRIMDRMLVPNNFAADLWPVFNFDHPNERYERFLSRRAPALKRLIESIIIHRETIVPTDDFLSLTVLVGALGEKSVISLLEADRLRFLRIRGSVGYLGNGVGLSEFYIGNKDNPSSQSAPPEYAIAWALDGLSPKPTDPALKSRVLESCVEVDVKTMVAAVRDETYTAIQKSDILRTTFALRNRELNRLAGVEPDGVRIYGGMDAVWHGDEIDVLAAMAMANLELRLADFVQAGDRSTAAPIGHLFQAKAERFFGRNFGEAFVELREIADVPDIGELVLQKQVTVEQLIKLSESRNGQQFQRWFHDHCRSDTLTTAREYANLLNTIPVIQKAPAKVIRFVVAALLGKIPLLGDIAGAVDAFVLERIARGSSAKYFIQELEQLGRSRRHK